MKAKEKIGLFGGAFDPIHTGHLIVAELAADFAGLGRVLFMPTAVPPHKSPTDLAPFEERSRMVEIAIADNPRFELSFLERRPDVSYTYESILQLRRQGYGRDTLHLLVGSDSLEEISSWRRPEEIYRNATIIAMRRPGAGRQPALPAEAALIFIESGGIEISSSDIRRRVRAGRSIRYLVPREVERFIADHALYREAER